MERTVRLRIIKLDTNGKGMTIIGREWERNGRGNDKK